MKERQESKLFTLSFLAFRLSSFTMSVVCTLGCPYSKERKLNRADAIVAPNGPNEPSIGYNRGVGELMGA